MTALLGPNGSGKTTLIRCLTRLLRPASGEVRIGDRSVSEGSAAQRLFGYVPQNPSLPGLGTPVLLACLGSVACLLLGRVCGVLAPVVAFAGLVVGQHLLPGSVLTRWFATGREWHSTWWLVALAPMLVAVVAWWTRGIPLPQRRG